MIDNNLKIENKYNGVVKEESFMRFNKDLIGDIQNSIFKPTAEGKFDYMVYVSLLTLCNYEYYFLTNLNQLVKYLGYKPKLGKGKINDKVEQSIQRLCVEYKLVDLHYEDGCMEGEVGLVSNDDFFFKMYLHKLGNIYNSFGYKKGNNKYTDKASAIYLYSYLLSKMGIHKPYNTYEFYGCFPSIETICKECNLSKTNVTKLLRYFELDNLIYTLGYDKVVGDNKGLIIGNKYYTNDKRYLQAGYYFSEGYYKSKEYKLKSKNYYIERLCVDIDKELTKVIKDLDTKDKKNEFVEFKKELQFKFEEIKNDYKLNSYDTFMIKNAKYNNITNFKMVLFLSEINDVDNYESILALTRFKNIVSALQYKYGLK